MKKILMIGLLAGIMTAGFGLPEGYSQSDVTSQKKIAANIIDRIKGLEEFFPHFVAVEEKATVSEMDGQFWMAFEYQNDVQNVIDEETQQEVKHFSEEKGIDVSIYFYNGAWEGEGEAKPFTFGDMNVLVYVEGPLTEELQVIRATIGQIVLDEKKNYERNLK